MILRFSFSAKGKGKNAISHAAKRTNGTGLFALQEDQACKHQSGRYRWWKSKANVGPYLDHHSSLPGKSSFTDERNLDTFFECSPFFFFWPQWKLKDILITSKEMFNQRWRRCSKLTNRSVIRCEQLTPGYVISHRYVTHIISGVEVQTVNSNRLTRLASFFLFFLLIAFYIKDH